MVQIVFASKVLELLWLLEISGLPFMRQTSRQLRVIDPSLVLIPRLK
jgi:hypothetical protein